MTKLSDTQAIILSAAAQRADGNLLPLPGSLRGGAAVKVVGALLARGLAREEVTDRTTRADSALNTVWRNEDDGRAVLLYDHRRPALAAIGVEPRGRCPTPATSRRPTPPARADSAGEPAAGAGERAGRSAAPAKRRRSAAGRRRRRATGADAAPAPRKTRDDTKQAQLIAMLRRKEGATIAQIVAATGWQPHTVRGAFAGALKKKLGLTVTSEKVEGGERV